MSTTSSNSWVRRVEADSAADHALDVKPVYRDAPLELTNDTTWRVILAVMWLLGSAAVYNQTLVYGWTMLLTFIVMEGLFTTLVIAIWKRSK